MKKISIERENLILKMYNDGIPLTKIYSKLKTSSPVIYRILDKHKIDRRVQRRTPEERMKAEMDRNARELYLIEKSEERKKVAEVKPVKIRFLDNIHMSYRKEVRKSMLITVYHLILDSIEGLYVRNLHRVNLELSAFAEGAEQHLKSYCEYNVERCIEDITEMDEGEAIEFGDFKIICLKMTEAQFNNLPKFYGY